jgi:hypothetical protein
MNVQLLITAIIMLQNSRIKHSWLFNFPGLFFNTMILKTYRALRHFFKGRIKYLLKKQVSTEVKYKIIYYTKQKKGINNYPLKKNK